MTPMQNEDTRMLAVGRGKSSNLGLVALEYVAWKGLVAMSSEPLEASIEHAAFMALPKSERNRLKKAPFVSFGVFEGGIRNRDTVASRSAAQLDYDQQTLELFRRLEERELTGGVVPFAYVAHTTRSHTDEAPRLRLMVPFSRDVTPAEYPLCVRALHSLFGAPELDEGSLQPSRLMYLPVINQNAPFWHWQSFGTGYVDPDYLIGLAQPKNKEEKSDLDIALADQPKTFKQNVNALAMKAFAAWVPTLFPQATPYKQGGYRVTSTSLGRELEEDISIVAEGIKDFGVADLDDPRSGKRTPIELVREWGEHKDSEAAANWLCIQLGVKPEALGGERSREDTDKAFKFHSGDDYARDFTVSPELVEDMLPAQGLAMLFGPSGTGKTFWGLDLACRVHNGVKWRDKDVAKGDVMYIAAEASRGIKKRFQAIKILHADWVMPFVADVAPNLSSLTSVQAVRDAARLVGKPAIIVIDTLSASFEGDDSSQQDIAKMLRNLKILADDLQCLVLFVHHTTKDGGSWRGSGVLFNDVDAVLETVEQGEGAERKLWVTQRKHKEGEAGKSYSFRLLVSEPLAAKPNGKPITSCTIEQEDHAAPKKEAKTKTRADDFATSEKHSKARHYLSIIEHEIGLDGADVDEKGIVRAIQADKTVNPLCEEGHPRADNIRRTLLTLADKGKIRLEGRYIRLCK